LAKLGNFAQLTRLLGGMISNHE